MSQEIRRIYVKVELALRYLRRHKQALIESAGEDLGWKDLDEAIQILEEVD